MSGETLYTRDGHFRTDADGRLTTQAGALVSPGIQVPQGGTLVIGSDGSVYVGSWDCNMYCIGTSGPTEGMVPARPSARFCIVATHSAPLTIPPQALWYFTVPGGGVDSPCAIKSTAAIDAASSTLYFTSSLASGLYALNMSTSSPLWVFNASMKAPSSGAPVIAVSYTHLTLPTSDLV